VVSSSYLVGVVAVRIILASATSSISAICPNMERCHDWIIAVRLGKHRSQATLIKSINPACIHPGD